MCEALSNVVPIETLIIVLLTLSLVIAFHGYQSHLRDGVRAYFKLEAKGLYVPGGVLFQLFGGGVYLALDHFVGTGDLKRVESSDLSFEQLQVRGGRPLYLYLWVEPHS